MMADASGASLKSDAPHRLSVGVPTKAQETCAGSAASGQPPRRAKSALRIHSTWNPLGAPLVPARTCNVTWNRPASTYEIVGASNAAERAGPASAGATSIRIAQPRAMVVSIRDMMACLLEGAAWCRISMVHAVREGEPRPGGGRRGSHLFVFKLGGSRQGLQWYGLILGGGGRRGGKAKRPGAGWPRAAVQTCW